MADSTPEMLSGAEMIVQSLIDEGVQQIFGYPGGSVLDIYDALHEKRENIQHVLVRHEQAATHMLMVTHVLPVNRVWYWCVLALVRPTLLLVSRLLTWTRSLWWCSLVTYRIT